LPTAVASAVWRFDEETKAQSALFSIGVGGYMIVALNMMFLEVVHYCAALRHWQMGVL
jgi:hypothetical protein